MYCAISFVILLFEEIGIVRTKMWHFYSLEISMETRSLQFCFPIIKSNVYRTKIWARRSSFTVRCEAVRRSKFKFYQEQIFENITNNIYQINIINRYKCQIILQFSIKFAIDILPIPWQYVYDIHSTSLKVTNLHIGYITARCSNDKVYNIP